MQYGFILPHGDIHTLAELANAAEVAGWDGVFYWDGIYIQEAGPMYDPWIVLAAMALRTDHVRLGLILTPPSRRRPWKLARETVTLDHLSHGRLILHSCGNGSDHSQRWGTFCSEGHEIL